MILQNGVLRKTAESKSAERLQADGKDTGWSPDLLFFGFSH